MSDYYNIVKIISHDFSPHKSYCYIANDFEYPYMDRLISKFIRNIREQGNAEKYIIPLEDRYRLTFEGAKELANHINNDGDFEENGVIANELHESIKEIQALEKVENCPIHMELCIIE